MHEFTIIGRAGASPPSRTAAIIFLYIIYIYIVRPTVLAPGWPRATRKRSRPDRGTGWSQITAAIMLYILVVRICQTSKVRTKADTAMNSDETSHPRGRSRERRPAESDEQRDARLQISS